MKLTTITTLCLLLVGCASRPPHARIMQAPTMLCTAQAEKPSAQHPCLGEEVWQCDGSGTCYLARSWEPSQLTVAGCALHYVVTLGKVPLECRSYSPPPAVYDPSPDPDPDYNRYQSDPVP